MFNEPKVVPEPLVCAVIQYVLKEATDFGEENIPVLLLFVEKKNPQILDKETFFRNSYVSP